MNASRTLSVTPTRAEDLWRRLATVLPQLLRLHVQARVDDRDVASTPLPDLIGPIDKDNRRRYECSERGTCAHITLCTEANETGTYHTVAGAIISSTVSTGLVVFQLGTYTEPSDQVFLKCYDQFVDDIVALIQSVEPS